MKPEKLQIYTSLLNKHGKGKKLLDIATGHGKYAILAHRIGYQVTAFDARPDRVPVSYPGIEWQIANLKIFNYAGYDIINCLGILYHLPIEEQERLLRKINYTTVILDTHICLNNSIDFHDYQGSHYREAASIENLKGRPLAAFDEVLAFWHTLPSLIRLFNNCKLNTVELVQYLPDRIFCVLKPKD